MVVLSYSYSSACPFCYVVRRFFHFPLSQRLVSPLCSVSFTTMAAIYTTIFPLIFSLSYYSLLFKLLFYFPFSVALFPTFLFYFCFVSRHIFFFLYFHVVFFFVHAVGTFLTALGKRPGSRVGINERVTDS